MPDSYALKRYDSVMAARIDAINQAGGPNGIQGATSSANALQVVVRRQGQVILTIQFSDLLAGGEGFAQGSKLGAQGF